MTHSPQSLELSGESRSKIEDIGRQFAIRGELTDVREIKTGHINSTYRSSYLRPNGETNRYILQSINHHVFKDPLAVMRNVEAVTRHINSRVLRLKKDLGGQTLSLFPARDGRVWVEDAEGAVWRCYNFIEGCVTYDVVENTRQAYQAARAFGSFQDLVSDLPADSIVETIPDFHNTPKRFARLMDVAGRDPKGRLASVAAEYEFIRKREDLTNCLLQHWESGAIPMRITHNDTKINNVMIDADLDEAVCVIDLDTVMPGLALYDFGDLARSATSPAAEDERDLSKVQMQMSMFEALVEGYLDAASGFLNEQECALLVDSAKLLTFEVGIRFLTDFLEGDVYFKTERAGHNLDRCRTQLKLVERMEEQEKVMRKFADTVVRSKR